jgi:hypothetical protein
VSLARNFYGGGLVKFYGIVGISKEFVEDPNDPGVHKEVIDEVCYFGDVLTDRRRWASTDTVNDDVIITNTVSILADSYAFAHIPFIRYVELNGVRYKVANVEIARPRLILSLGGLYNQ